MPTYVSNSNTRKSASGVSFNPGQEVQLNRYLNLNDYPWLVKVSDLPEIKSQANLIFSNASTATNMSSIYTLDNKKIIEIRDGEGSNVDGDSVELRIFMGHTDDQADFVPYKDVMKFVRITQADVNGTKYPFWYPVNEASGGEDYEENLIPDPHWPVPYPFFSIAVVAASLGGSVNIYTRDIRQITQHMV